MAPLHPELGPISILACLSLLLPLPWHWRARNVATLSIIFWFFVANFVSAVNSFVWSDNVSVVIPVWCDITTKLMVGANYALPASCLCISMYLEKVASLRSAQSTAREKRMRLWFEAFMGFGLPITFMALHIIVQGHRFDIVEGYGCRPTTYYSIPAIFLVWVPPLLLALGSVFYSGLALRHFFIRRLTFAAHLQASSSALTTSRYLRLMSMAAMQMVASITITSYALWFSNTALPLRPWTNWADVHSDFWRVDLFPAHLMPKPIARSFYILWWFTPLSTSIFVGFFAFGKDALEEYKRCGRWVKEKVFRIKEDDGAKKMNMKGPKFSFIKSLSSSPQPSVRPTISNPVLQSITSLDYTLPPYDSLYKNAGTFSVMSSLEQGSTTLHGHSRSGSSSSADHDDFRYEYRLRDSRCRFTDNFTTSPTRHSFKFAQPKAIGSYSDLSIYSPSSSTAMSPSSTVIGHSDSPKKAKEGIEEPASPLANSVAASHPHEYYTPQRRTPSPTASIPSPEPVYAAAQGSPSPPSRLRPLLLGQTQDRRSWRPVTYPSYEAETWSIDSAEGQP